MSSIKDADFSWHEVAGLQEGYKTFSCGEGGGGAGSWEGHRTANTRPSSLRLVVGTSSWCGFYYEVCPFLACVERKSWHACRYSTCTVAKKRNEKSRRQDLLSPDVIYLVFSACERGGGW